MALGGDLEESEGQPLTDGERAVLRPVQPLVEAAAQPRVVGVVVLLHQAVGQGRVLVEDQLLHQLGDGEHPQLGGAPGLLHDEGADELGGLQVVLSDKENGQWGLLLDLHEGEDLVENILHVLVEVGELRSEAVRPPGKVQHGELVSHWQRVQGREELEIKK